MSIPRNFIRTIACEAEDGETLTLYEHTPDGACVTNSLSMISAQFQYQTDKAERAEFIPETGVFFVPTRNKAYKPAGEFIPSSWD